jgi:hypothetical protein
MSAEPNARDLSTALFLRKPFGFDAMLETVAKVVR